MNISGSLQSRRIPMDRIVQASERERKAIFTETSAIIKIPVEMIEKDFWVCWTLSRLFFFI